MLNRTRFNQGIDLALAILFWCFAAWLFTYPAGTPSDDALFFTRSLERFSVLEFSPHFPGYPGFVLLGRVFQWFTGSGESALQLLSISAALTIPPLVALIVLRVTGDSDASRCAFLIALLQPLLPLLGLCQLSDATGIALFLLSLLVLHLKQWLLAGVVLGFAFCCRPSYGVFHLAAMSALFYINRRYALRTLLGSGLVVLPIFGVVLTLEGWAYVEEMQRFIEGHVSVWGNSAVSAERAGTSWIDTMFLYPGLALLLMQAPLAVWVAFRRHQVPVLSIAGVALLAGMIWVGLVQNPESLRHLAPLLILSGVLIPCVHLPLVRHVAGLLIVTLSIGLTAATLVPERRSPPLIQVVHHLAQQPPGVVVTNHGVEVMGQRLTQHRVFDAYYKGYVDHAQRTAVAPVYRVSSTVLANRTVQFFPGRVFGESSYWVAGTPAKDIPSAARGASVGSIN